MNTNEVLSELRKLGITATEQDLKDYARKGLIPKPTEIVIKKNNISAAQRTGRQYYAHTDKGIIYGSTAEIVQRKIARAGAGPYIIPKKESKNIAEIDCELPF